jgi:ABC-type sugar transport system permease subunit
MCVRKRLRRLIFWKYFGTEGVVVIVLVFSHLYKFSVISYTCSLLEITAWNLDNKLVTFLSILMQNWLIHSMFMISCR